MPFSSRHALLAALPALAACASAPRNAPSAVEAPAAATANRSRPLAVLQGAERAVVMPTRHLVVDPRLAAGAAIDTAAGLMTLDDAIRGALTARGVGDAWVWADAARRSVARSAGMVPDLRRLNVDALLGARSGDQLPIAAPLAAQLRTVAALHDARYVLYPLMVTLAPATSDPRGPTQASLRLALVDVRVATVEWAGTVVSEPVARPGPTPAAAVATRLADLVAPPR